MKYVALSLCVFAVVVSAVKLDEDETAILRSPFHQHAADFRSQVQSFLQSRPTGRPRDVYKYVHGKYLDALKALSAQRPTGRPFANHKARAEHKHATWQLHSGYRAAQSALRNWSRKIRMDARKAAAKKDEDETEVIVSSPVDHAKQFRDHFENLLAQRPTGRPDFDGYKDMIEKKYREAKEQLKATSDRHAYKKAYDELKKNKHQIEKKVHELKHQAEAEHKKGKHEHHKKPARGEEKNAPSDKFLAAVAEAKGFRDHFENWLAQRPTGRPDFDGYKHMIEKKYREAKEQLKATGDRHEYKKAYDELKKQVHDVKAQVHELEKQVDEEEKMAKVVASPYGPHVEGFRKHLEDAYAQRPTGRPLKDFMKDIRHKYEEFKNNLKQSKPDKKSSRDEKELFDTAYHMLKSHMKDANEKIKAWRHQVEERKHAKHGSHKQDEDETAILSSSFGSKVNQFRNHLNDLFSQRPTGRPDFEGYKNLVKDRYDEVKEQLKAAGEKTRLTDDQEDDLEDALEQLKEHKKDVYKKIKGWKKDDFNDKLALSPFGIHVIGFKDHSDDLFSQNPRPTGRPGVDQLMDQLEKKYKEAKANMKSSKPGVDASKEDKEFYEDAYDLLKDHMDDAEDLLEDWEEELEEEEMRAKVAGSPYAQHLKELKERLANVLSHRPTGRPSLDKLQMSLKKTYSMAKDKLKANKPGKKATDEEKDVYESAYDMLKDHMSEAKDKVEAWRQQVEERLKQSTNQDVGDETEVLVSSFMTHAENLKKEFNALFENRKDGELDAKQYFNFLHLRYTEAKQRLREALRDSLAANGEGQKRLYKEAIKQLVENRNEAERKVKSWAKNASN